jgi:hypothetical protein
MSNDKRREMTGGPFDMPWWLAMLLALICTISLVGTIVAMCIFAREFARMFCS